MEESSSEIVVIPDSTDSLADKADEEAEREDQGNAVADHSSAPTTVDEVPVSTALPVASLINVSGATASFNVITPEQLQLASGGSLRPILCVENSCLCDGSHDKECTETTQRATHWFRNENGHIKATHIVIENQEETSIPTNASWLASANQPVIPVRCKNTSAELHKSRFGSGGRGKCIKYEDAWYTPSEFEVLCGRGSSKDWKRSLRFGGRSLQSLIEGGILYPHATSCTCSVCCDDDRAVGPVRLFIPYKRKRKRDPNEALLGKIKNDSSLNGGGHSTNGEESCDSTEMDANGSQGQLQQTVAAPPTILEEQPCSPNNGSMAETLSRLDKLSTKLVKLVFQLRKEVDEVKAQWKTEQDQLKSEHKRDKEQAVLSARVEAQVACSRAVFDSAVHVVDPLGTVGLQPSEGSDDTKKCSNCNREAFAECSLCTRTPYCSTFCQRKDWANHQLECVRSATNDSSSSIMLIVQSSDQVMVQE